jgi:hypothetical protein
MKDKHDEYELPADGPDLLSKIGDKWFLEFDDSFLDLRIRRAADQGNSVEQALADCLQARKAPKLLHEELVLVDRGHTNHHSGTAFKTHCTHGLVKLAADSGVELGRFLFVEKKPLKFEERSPDLTRGEAEQLPPEQREELIKVYDDRAGKFVPLIEMENMLVQQLASRHYKLYRLYVVCDDTERVQHMKDTVRAWFND